MQATLPGRYVRSIPELEQYRPRIAADQAAAQRRTPQLRPGVAPQPDLITRLGSRLRDLYGPGGAELANIRRGLGQAAETAAGLAEPYQKYAEPIGGTLLGLSEYLQSRTIGPANIEQAQRGEATRERLGRLVRGEISLPEYGEEAREEFRKLPLSTQMLAQGIPELLTGGVLGRAAQIAKQAAPKVVPIAERVPGVATAELRLRGVPAMRGAAEEIPPSAAAAGRKAGEVTRAPGGGLVKLNNEEQINRYVNLLPSAAERRYGVAYTSWIKGGAVAAEPERLRGVTIARANTIKADIQSFEPWGRPSSPEAAAARGRPPAPETAVPEAAVGGMAPPAAAPPRVGVAPLDEAATARFRALTPEQKAKTADKVRANPRMTPEEKEARLRILEDREDVSPVTGLPEAPEAGVAPPAAAPPPTAGVAPLARPLRTPDAIRADLANAMQFERRAAEVPGLRAELHEALQREPTAPALAGRATAYGTTEAIDTRLFYAQQRLKEAQQTGDKELIAEWQAGIDRLQTELRRREALPISAEAGAGVAPPVRTGGVSEGLPPAPTEAVATPPPTPPGAPPTASVLPVKDVAGQDIRIGDEVVSRGSVFIVEGGDRRGLTVRSIQGGEPFQIRGRDVFRGTPTEDVARISRQATPSGAPPRSSILERAEAQADWQSIQDMRAQARQFRASQPDLADKMESLADDMQQRLVASREPPPGAPPREPPTGGPPEVALSPAAAGNRFVAPLRDFAEVEREVVTRDDLLAQVAGRTGINPAVLRDDTVGRAVTAFERQRVSAQELTDVALAAALDTHAQRVTGRMRLPITNEGIWRPAGKPWQDVFSNAADVDALPAAQKAYVKDYLQVIEEVEKLRVAAGLEARGKTREGWFYVPRQVKGIRGVELRRPSSPKLQRVYEEAADGFAKGVRYDNNPRATLEVHIRAAYREIAEKQLSDALEPLSIKPSALVPELIRARMETAVAERLAAERARRALVVSKATEAIAPEEALTLRGAPFGREPIGMLAPARRQADARLAAARREYNIAKNLYSRAMESARRKEVAPGALFGRTEDTIAIANWRNRYYPLEQQQALVDALGQFGGRQAVANPFARGVEVAANYTRFLAAVGDFAAPFIQGLPLLARNPVAWGRATMRHYEAFFDPTVQARLIRDKLETFQKMAQHGIPIGDPEFFAAIKSGGGLSPGKLLALLPRGQEIRGLAQGVGRQSFGRFQASYNTFLGYSRALLWEGSEKHWGNLDNMAAWIRNMTGGLDSRALGVGPNQRGLEGGWLAFSPRLFRSTTALIGDALRPNTQQGRESLRALGSLAAGATGIYILTGYALGKSREEIETGLNPLNGKRFLSHQVNGDWIGVGGQVRAITQLIAKAATDPKSLTSLDAFDNPLIAFYRSRGAPAMNIIGAPIEALTGVDALPFSQVDSLPDVFKHIGRSALPFVVQSVLEGQKPASLIAQEVGARTSPQTPGEAQTAAFGEAGLGEPATMPFMEEWAGALQAQAEGNPKPMERTQAKLDAEKRSDPDMWAYHTAQVTNQANRDESIASTEADYAAGKINARDRRVKIQDAISQEAKQNTIAREPVRKELEGIPESGDAAYAEYQSYLSKLYADKGTTDVALEDVGTGEFNFDEYKRRQTELATEYGAEKVAGFEARRRADPNPVIREYHEAQDKIEASGWWEIGPRVVAEIKAAKSPDFMPGDNSPVRFFEALYQDYYNHAQNPGKTPTERQVAAEKQVNKWRSEYYKGKDYYERKLLDSATNEVRRALLELGYLSREQSLVIDKELAGVR